MLEKGIEISRQWLWVGFFFYCLAAKKIYSALLLSILPLKNLVIAHLLASHISWPVRLCWSFFVTHVWRQLLGWIKFYHTQKDKSFLLIMQHTWIQVLFELHAVLLIEIILKKSCDGATFCKNDLTYSVKEVQGCFCFFKPAYKTFWHQRIFCCFSNGKLPRLVMD